MFAFLNEFFARRALKRLSAASLSPPAEPPPLPSGWRIVRHATPGVTAYEVSAPIDPAAQQRRGAGFIGSVEFVGTNSTEFHGFPPDTLQIGAVSVRMDAATRQQRLTLRFDYKADGWRRTGSMMPACDFNLLPLTQPEPEVA